MKKVNIEVEGGELLIKSKEGFYAIVPSKDRQKVRNMVKGRCDDCINNYIQTLPRYTDYAEDGTVIVGENSKAVTPPDPPIIKTLSKDNRMPIIVYDEKKAKDMKFEGGNFYIPYHATKKFIDLGYSYEDIFSAVMADRDVYKDYYQSRFNYAFDKTLRPAIKAAKEKYSNIDLSRGSITSTDEMLYKYDPYIEQQYNAQTMEDKKKNIEANMAKYQELFLEKEHPIFTNNPEAADLLFGSRDKLEKIYYSTEGRGTESDAFGIRSMSFVDNPEKEANINVIYKDSRYIGTPLVNTDIIRNIYKLQYDPSKDDIYYKITGFDLNDTYATAKKDVINSEKPGFFWIDDKDYRKQIVNSTEEILKNARSKYEENISKEPHKYLPISKIKEINPELFE